MKSSLLFTGMSFFVAVILVATANDAVAQSGRPGAFRPQASSIGHGGHGSGPMMGSGHRPTSGGQYRPSYPSGPFHYGGHGGYFPPPPHGGHGGYGHGGHRPPHHGGHGGYFPHHPPVIMPATCYHQGGGIIVKVGGIGVFRP